MIFALTPPRRLEEISGEKITGNDFVSGVTRTHDMQEKKMRL
jgi:hypothetical protein